MQTISSQPRASHAHWHHSLRRHERAEPSHSERDGSVASRERAPHAGRTDAQGTFARAVFATFASYSVERARPDAESVQTASTQQAGASVVRFREKLKLELDVQDDGDVGMSLEVKAKVRVAGDATASDDVMQAMQAFAASLFSALRDLFDGLRGKPGAQAAPQAAAALPPVSPSVPSAPAPAVTPAPVEPQATDPAAVSVEPASSPDRSARWIGSYLSMETRVRMLAQHVEKAETDDAAAATANPLAGLRQQFEDIAGQLRGEPSAGLPSLAEFLRGLALEMENGQRASFSLAVSLRGAFVSTSA
jgi:hypothetical protein